MDKKASYYTDKLSDAAWLEGVCNKKCIELREDAESQGRVIFVFELDPNEGQRLVLEFGSSEAFRFDASVKNLKGRLFKKQKRGYER